MPQVDPRDAVLYPRCLSIAMELTEKYEWRLLTPAELARAMAAKSAPDASLSTLRRRALTCYSVVLYDACGRAAEPARRDMAFRDLYRYLHRLAIKRAGSDHAADVAQLATEFVLRKYDNCRSPETFFGFAAYQCLDAAKRVTRPKPLLEIERIDIEGLADQVITQEFLNWIHCALAQMSEDRRNAVVLKYFEGLSDREIGERLGKRSNTVTASRHHALKRLRVWFADEEHPCWAQ